MFLPTYKYTHIGLRVYNTYKLLPVYRSTHTFSASIYKHAHAYILPYIGLRLHTNTKYRPIQAYIP